MPPASNQSGCAGPARDRDLYVSGIRRRGRVLFVSADRDLRDVVTRVLEQEGYDVAAVDHSGHALLRCRISTIDVLVAELSGPDMSGPSLAEHVRRHCPGVRAVYLANTGTPDCIPNILVRPFTRDELVERIRIAAADRSARTAAAQPSRVPPVGPDTQRVVDPRSPHSGYV